MATSQQAYPTDLNDTQRFKVRPYLPTEAQVGRPCQRSWRAILNGIFYVLQSGRSWRMLPTHLPSPGKRSIIIFRLWRKEGFLERLNQVLRAKVRRRRQKRKIQLMGRLLTFSDHIDAWMTIRHFLNRKIIEICNSAMSSTE